MYRLFFFGLGLGLSACTPTDSTAKRTASGPRPSSSPTGTLESTSANAEGIDYATQLAPLIDSTCGPCHGEDGTEPDLTTEDGVKENIDAVLANVKAKHKKVVWKPANIALLTAYVAEVKAATKAAAAKAAKAAAKKASTNPATTAEPEVGTEEPAPLPAPKPSTKPSPKPSASPS